MPHSDQAAKKAYHRRYYEAHKAEGWNKHLRNESAEARATRLASMLAYMLKRQFGLSVERYEEMLAEQDGKCALCMKPPGAKAGRHGTAASLAVDHCHESGRVRRLLCAACNLKLGWFERNRRAVEQYLAQQGN